MTKISASRSILNYLLEKKGMSKDEIAKYAGVSRRMIDYALDETSGRNLGNKSIALLAERLNIHPAQLAQAASFQEEGLPPYDEISFVKKMNARPRGGDGGIETVDGYSSAYAFRSDWLSTKGTKNSMRLFDVVGDSMSPTIKEGDMVMIDTSKADEWQPGRVYLVTVNDAFMLKRAGVLPGYYVLKSDNEDKESYPDIQIAINSPDYFKCHGRLVWSCREF